MFKMFKVPTVAEVAARMLFEAQIDLLHAEAAKERADANLIRLQQMVARLTP